MAKKKKVFKSAALSQANRSREQRLRENLVQVVNGQSRLLNRPEDLYEMLADGLDDIETFKDPREQLELLAWTLRSDFIAFKADTDEEKEGWDALFYDAGTFFVELASQYSDKDYVADLVHDLALRHVGGEGRSLVFLSVEEFLHKERAQALLAELLDDVTEVDQGNREDILDAICDMADSIKDAATFAKAALLKDPDKSNATLIDIANAQFMAGNLELAKQWLGDVRRRRGGLFGFAGGHRRQGRPQVRLHQDGSRPVREVPEGGESGPPLRVRVGTGGHQLTAGIRPLPQRERPGNGLYATAGEPEGLHRAGRIPGHVREGTHRAGCPGPERDFRRPGKRRPEGPGTKDSRLDGRRTRRSRRV